jgi:uncharacterized protein DUF397
MNPSNPVWRKSTYSFSNGNCVEVASAPVLDTPEMVLVRDSKDPEGPRLSFSRREWARFTAAVRQV